MDIGLALTFFDLGMAEVRAVGVAIVSVKRYGTTFFRNAGRVVGWSRLESARERERKYVKYN